jgi:hypothetical protein
LSNKKHKGTFIVIPIENLGEKDIMTQKHEVEIKFTQDWGGKLNEDSFTTVRGQDKIYTPGKIYPVTLVAGLFHTKKAVGPCRLVKLEFKRIRDFTAEEIRKDIGVQASGENPASNFYKILDAFYGRKVWWNAEYTVVQKLLLEKVGITR